MKLQLQVSLDFLHLENALFCAEQSIAGGAELLEVGNCLIKNAGLQCIRILKEKFPPIPLVADLKMLTPETQEMKASADAGANGITISGAISESNWGKCLAQAQERNLKVFLDFRDIPVSVMKLQLPLVASTDCVVLNLAQESDVFGILQEIAFRYAKPIAATGITDLANLQEAMSLGLGTGIVQYQEEDTQNFKEATHRIHEAFLQIQQAAASQGSPREYSEQVLRRKLNEVMPSDICEVYRDKPLFLDKVYPLHRFTKVFGQAATIKMLGGGLPAMLDFLQEVPPKSIVVVDSGGEATPVWNTLTTVVAIKRNLAGVVLYGAITEVNLVRAKGFPCYVNSLTPLPTRESQGCLKNIPLQLGNVWVRPGDWILGDDCGVLCIPAEKIFTVTERALQLAKHKAQLLREIEDVNDSEKLKQLLTTYQNGYRNFLVDGP
jgi:3-hexulose-6-phosphate synthase/6-phospho-3-hexuloisomerase